MSWAPPRRRKGFTLVELLVVIGIIAVLIGILLPALNRARKSSRTTACLANESQLALGELQYFNDNKGHFSPYYDFSGIPPAPYQVEWMSQIPHPTQLNNARFCPEAVDANAVLMPATPPTGTGSGPNMFGAAFNSWGPYGQAMRYFDDQGNTQHMAGSYTYNGYLLRQDPSGDNGGLGGNNQGRNLAWLWVPPVKMSDTVPLICDGIWPTAWPHEADDVAGIPSIYYPGAAAATPATMDIANNWKRIVVARHYFAMNVAFMDGHAATVALPDLWKLNWHTNWNLADPATGLPAGETFSTVQSTLKALYKNN